MTTVSIDPAPARLAGSTFVNGRRVEVEWTSRAERALGARSSALIVELELYFSCLVKKSVHVRETAGRHPLSWVDERLAIYFRPVTSTACSIEQGMRAGRQPETEISGPAAQRFAPRRLRLDYRGGEWRGEFWL